MEFRELVRRRRMVRAFTDDVVAPESVVRIVDVARRGPSAGYSQGVDFIVVSDAATRERLTPPGQPHRNASLPNFVGQAPVLIVVCTSADVYVQRYGEADKAGVRGATPDEDFWNVPYWHTDAGAALMLILLAAVDEGLGAGVAGIMGHQGQERVRGVLGMPASYVAVALVAIGHAAPEATDFRGSAATRKRRTLTEVVHRERW
jgi:nitroreductase